jgi:hypothetical protein
MAFIERLKFYKRTPTKLSGCAFFGSVFLTCTALTLLSPWIFNSIEVTANKLKWLEQGINDYTISVSRSIFMESIVLTVVDGEIVQVENSSVTQAIQEVEFPRYEKYTVAGLFNDASNCVLLCSRSFDPVYGYPKVVNHTGFVENGPYVEVVDFQPLGSD